MRRYRGNDPCSDDFVSTTRRANQCASALADLHKTVALPPHVGHLPIFSGVPFRISMTSPTWSLVQACHPLLPVYFCQSSLGSWPGTSMCSHLPTESFIHLPGQSTCPFLHLEALHTTAPVPSHVRHFTEVLPKRRRLGVFRLTVCKDSDRTVAKIPISA